MKVMEKEKVRKQKLAKRVKKMYPSTVLQRIQAYIDMTGKPINITTELKQELGKIVHDKFFGVNNEMKNLWKRKTEWVRKIEVAEPEGIFRVLLYPSYFVRTIDAIIYKYFKDK